MAYPKFAAGEYYKIQAAVDSGVLTYPSYVYIRDEKKLAFIDQDSSINRIVGDNKECIINVDILPDVKAADVNTLYILDGIVYTFDGTEFKSMYKEVSLSDYIIEISKAEYELIPEEERKDKIYFIYDDDLGGNVPPVITFERNEDNTGVIIKSTNYDGSVSTSTIYDGKSGTEYEVIEETLVIKDGSTVTVENEVLML